MEKQRPNGFVAIITALSTLVSTIGTVIVIVITTSQSTTLYKVEQQGNSRELEVRRLIAVAYQRLAEETKKPADIAIYQDAQKSYEAAKRAFETNK